MILRTVLAILYLQLVALVAGQSGPVELPAITGPAGSGGECGGCYVVADVAGIVFGSEQLTQTEVQVISIATGRNGTNSTTTSVIAATGQFTFGTAGLVTGANGGFISYGASTVIEVGGATLTSPTPYEVFSAYSVTSTTVSNGQCVAVAGAPITVSPAFRVAVPSGAGANFAYEAENSFIRFVGLPTCSAGGANVAPTTATIVNTLTSTTTTVGPMPITPQAISTVAPRTTQQGFIQAATSRLAALASSGSTATTATAGTATTATAGTATTAAPSLTSQVSVGTVVVVGNSTAVYGGPTIVPFVPGNVAPARGPPAALWAGAATVAAVLGACLAL